MLYKDAVNYLNNIISKWKNFCKSHRRVSDAIKTILEDNEAKGLQINKLTNLLKEKNEEIARLRSQNNMLFIAGCDNITNENKRAVETVRKLRKKIEKLQRELNEKVYGVFDDDEDERWEW